MKLDDLRGCNGIRIVYADGRGEWLRVLDLGRTLDRTVAVAAVARADGTPASIALQERDDTVQVEGDGTVVAYSKP